MLKAGSRWEAEDQGILSRLEMPWSVAPLTPVHSGSPAPGGRELGGDRLRGVWGPGDG